MAADAKHMKMQIDISTAKANAELSKLANKLEKISASISEINNNGLKELMDSVPEAGAAALSGVEAAITGLADFKNRFHEINGELESLFGKEMMEVVNGSIKNLFAPLIEHVKEFISYISIGAGTIGESFSVAFGISAGAAAGIAAAIAAVVLVIVDLWNTSEQFRDAVGFAFNMVKDTVSDAFKKVGDAAASLWESIKGLGAALYDLYESSGLKSLVELLASLTVVLVGIVGSVLVEMLSSSLSGLAQVAQGAVDVVTGLVEIITGIFTLDPEKIMEGFSLIGEGLLEMLGGIKEALFGGFEEIWASIIEKMLEWWDGTALPFIQSIPEKFGELVEDIAAWFSELPDKIYDAIIFVIDKLGEWKENIIEFVTEKVPEIADKIYEFFEELPDKFIELGTDIISGLWKGIQDAWEGVKKGIGDFCSGFVDGFRDALDIHSPSKAMAEIGDYAILGLLEPFTDSGLIIEQLGLFAETLMNIFREQLSPENFTLIAESALLAFMTAFQLGFENMQLISGESMQLLSMSVINVLTLMNQQIGLIFTAITMLITQKWMLMLNQTRLIWMQMNLMVTQNLILLNTNITAGMTAVNMGWTARWNQFTATVRAACAEVRSAVSALNGSVQGMCNSMMSAIHAVKAAASSLGSVSVRVGTVRGFASGGYPETGELFLARENGMNEMVGRIGNRSAVANNDQIVEAIRGAVMQGLHADGQNTLLREQNTLLRAILEKDTDISLDGRSLVDGIDRARKRMGLSFQPA